MKPTAWLARLSWVLLDEDLGEKLGLTCRKPTLKFFLMIIQKQAWKAASSCKWRRSWGLPMTLGSFTGGAKHLQNLLLRESQERKSAKQKTAL